MKASRKDFRWWMLALEHGFFMPVEGVRLSIYDPPFDRQHPDRIVSASLNYRM